MGAAWGEACALQAKPGTANGITLKRCAAPGKRRTPFRQKLS